MKSWIEQKEYMWGQFGEPPAHAVATVIRTGHDGKFALCGRPITKWPLTLSRQASGFDQVCGQCVFKLNQAVIEGEDKAQLGSQSPKCSSCGQEVDKWSRYCHTCSK